MKIIAAVDGSEQQPDALALAAQLADLHGAELPRRPRLPPTPAGVRPELPVVGCLRQWIGRRWPWSAPSPCCRRAAVSSAPRGRGRSRRRRRARASGPAEGREASAPRSSSRGPWRLARPPIVVLWKQIPDAPPSFEVYFRMNRPLPRGRPAVTVALEGAVNLDGTGTGYDARVGPRCYARGFDNFDDYPPSLRRARPGDRVRVTLFLRRPDQVIRRTVRIELAGADEPAPPSPSRFWARRLGC